MPEDMQAFVAVCVGTIFTMVVVFFVACFIRLHRPRREKFLQQKRKESRLADLRAYQAKIASVDVQMIAEVAEVPVEEVNRVLGYPALWKELAGVKGNLRLLLLLGTRLRAITSGNPFGLYELWNDEMNWAVERTPAERLTQFLPEYAESIKNDAFEDKIIPRCCDSLPGCWELAKNLSWLGQEKCRATYEEIVRQRAVKCASPEDILALLDSIPFGQNNQPVDTREAIRIVIDRLCEIYTPLVDDAMIAADLDCLKLPHAYYDAYHPFADLRHKIVNKRSELIRTEIRQLAGLEE